MPVVSLVEVWLVVPLLFLPTALPMATRTVSGGNRDSVIVTPPPPAAPPTPAPSPCRGARGARPTARGRQHRNKHHTSHPHGVSLVVRRYWETSRHGNSDSVRLVSTRDRKSTRLNSSHVSESRMQ